MNNTLTEIPSVYTELLNKDYQIPFDFEAFFVEVDDIPVEFTPQFVPEGPMMKFTKGDSIVVHSIHPTWYGVELSTGKKGILYFWIGD